jgi:hypothetical protein
MEWGALAFLLLIAGANVHRYRMIRSANFSCGLCDHRPCAINLMKSEVVCPLCGSHGKVILG